MKPSLSLQEAESLLSSNPTSNLLPIFTQIPADLLTPVAAYLRLTDGCTSSPAFLLESIVDGSSVSRYSYVGANPLKILRTGNGQSVTGDPLVPLQQELDQYKFIQVPGLPPFTGGAIGYVSYDCVYHFEPTTKPTRVLEDEIKMPESVFMICDTILVFDHIFQTIKIVSHLFVPPGSSTPVSQLYDITLAKLRTTYEILLSNKPLSLPQQPKVPEDRQEPVSNVGQSGYQSFVTSLRQNIVKGDIIQAVPSQRMSKPTALHPFNAYRHLRSVNPSPYMFYVDCGDGLSLVGASPECLCAVDGGRVTNHAIAGTIRRGATPAEDEANAKILQSSLKDRAEHVMLVDLARNDVNRVCKPETVKVDSLMQVEKFSHVMHLTSQVSGMLRDGLNRFDAFRSIFPAGTVSGAPKLRAIQLISDLEPSLRGVYAGAVGRFNFSDTEMDTCIAIRTMVFHKGTVYAQAGGGIVFDSVEEEEWEETRNKLKANLTCIKLAEDHYAELQDA